MANRDGQAPQMAPLCRGPTGTAGCCRTHHPAPSSALIVGPSHLPCRPNRTDRPDWRAWCADSPADSTRGPAHILFARSNWMRRSLLLMGGCTGPASWQQGRTLPAAMHPQQLPPSVPLIRVQVPLVPPASPATPAPPVQPALRVKPAPQGQRARPATPAPPAKQAPLVQPALRAQTVPWARLVGAGRWQVKACRRVARHCCSICTEENAGTEILYMWPQPAETTLGTGTKGEEGQRDIEREETAGQPCPRRGHRRNWRRGCHRCHWRHGCHRPDWWVDEMLRLLAWVWLWWQLLAQGAIAGRDE